MKAIISRHVNGSFAEVGMSNRVLVSHYKTREGVRRFAKKYAANSPSRLYRIEYFTDENFYGLPYAAETGRA